METISLDKFIEKNDLQKPLSNDFKILKDNFSFFKNHEYNEEISDYNFERAILLYGLIEKIQPQNSLEIGTSTGYGTLSMVSALKKTNSKIFTIDIIGSETKINNYFLLKNTLKSNVTTRNELWKKFCKKDWFEKIIFLNGYSSEIFSTFLFPSIDFFYIDGAHFYDAFKFDFFSCLKLSNSKSYFLCDDYIERTDYGVKKFIDESLEPIIKTTLIKTDASQFYLKNKITNKDYGMCFFEIDKSQMQKYFSERELIHFTKKYLKFEKRYKLRKNINKKIPFLKNIRFKNFLSN